MPATIPATASATADQQAPQPIYVAGEWVATAAPIDVVSPADGPVVGRTYHATEVERERAIAAAVAAERPLARMPAYERGGALRSIAAGILERREELATLIALEVGKPIRDARTEVDRTALTFRLAGEEAERQYGEVLPLDLNAASRGRTGIVRRFPVGAVAGITPFNLPLGLPAHKLAPAIACGCPIVLKPASNAALSLLRLTELIDAAGLPAGAVSVIPMDLPVGDGLVTDERFKLLSFTGSPRAGWDMKARAGRKRVVLELGGNAAAIVDASADVDWAVQRCAAGAFKYGGQLCISVQRVLVHTDVWDRFVDGCLAAARELRAGHPLDAATDLAPLIDDAAAQRVQSWVDDACAAGGRLLIGGRAEGRFMPPTVLVDVPADAALSCEEAFAPVLLAWPFGEFDEALAAVNASRFGLQAGVFTNDLRHAWRAFEELEVGAVLINDSPTYRVDHMPYGGVKESGLGREGLRWAIEDMTEPRMMVMAQP